MKKWILSLWVLGCLILAGTSVVQHKLLVKERRERTRYQHNTEVLLQDVNFLKTSDSLNSAMVQQLELKNSELKKACAQDLKDIQGLKIKNKNLEHLIKNASHTEIYKEIKVYDTLVKTDSILLPIKCFDYNDNYIKLSGCFTDSKLDISILMEDTIYITEMVKYKRFLGFLWKTKKVKEQHWDILTRNKYTKFTDFKVVKVIY